MSSSGSQKRVFQHGHEHCRVDKDGDWEEMSSQTDSEEELLAAQRARYAEEEKDEVLDEIVGVLKEIICKNNLCMHEYMQMYAYMWTWQDTAMDCMESCLESIAFLLATNCSPRCVPKCL